MTQTTTTSIGNIGFADVLKKYCAENKRTIILWFAAALGTPIVTAFLAALTGSSSGSTYIVLTVLLLGILGTATASQMFGDMKSKQGRIALLMEPADAWQKFLARWIVWVPAMLILSILALWLGDMVRVGLDHILHENSHATLSSLGDFSIRNPGLAVTVLLLIYLASQSFFVLGSIIWPKLSFVKTLIALWVLQTLVSWFAVAGVMITEANLQHLNWAVMDTDIAENSAMGVMIAIPSAICLINWGLTWLRLRESEVIK